MNKKEIIEKRVLDNQRFVYYLAKKMNDIKSYSVPDDDIIDSGMIGLFKAASTFDETKGVQFSIYADRCINNEMRLYYRNLKKSAKDISFEEQIATDKDGNNLFIKDIVEDSKSNFVEKLIIREEVIRAIEVILNRLERKDRIVMLYKIGGKKQKDIANELRISEGYVSRIYKRVSKAVCKICNDKVNYAKFFSVDIEDDEYRFYIHPRDIDKCNIFLENLLKKVYGFEIETNCNRIIISMLAEPESFLLIGKIIQEMEFNNIRLVSMQ